MYKRIVTLLFFFCSCHIASSQQLRTSAYDVPVLTTPAQQVRCCRTDSNQCMVELKQQIPGLVYDLRYATAANFVQQAVYPTGTAATFLRLPAGRALEKVQQTLQLQGLGLKIFDAYRPYHVTVRFWELVGDERYVAHPSKGSGHNRGLAVDLTIINLQTGKELDMGTGFDHFSDTAHHSFTALPVTVMANRKLLKDLMVQYGFRPLDTEWWHYSWPNDRNYPVLDLSFNQLRRIRR